MRQEATEGRRLRRPFRWWTQIAEVLPPSIGMIAPVT